MSQNDQPAEPKSIRRTPALYLQIFWSTFVISAFTIGGGYVIVPLMQKKFVEKLHWIEEKEMMDLVAVGQSAPGAIAINTSVLVGYRMAGILGAVVSMLGTVLPPFVIIAVISLFYEAFRDNIIVAAVLRGMKAGVAAVLVDAVYGMAVKVGKEKSLMSYLLMIGAFLIAYLTDINVIYILIVCALIGIIATAVKNKKKKKENAGVQQ